MWQMFLRGLVFGVLRRIFVILSAPVVLIAATPIIFIRAAIVAARKQQTFRFAVMDAYDSVLHALFLGFAWPYRSELDTLERIHRKSSNQTLQPTADGLENYKGERKK
jgi:hypothetical protein